MANPALNHHCLNSDPKEEANNPNHHYFNSDPKEEPVSQQQLGEVGTSGDQHDFGKNEEANEGIGAASARAAGASTEAKQAAWPNQP